MIKAYIQLDIIKFVSDYYFKKETLPSFEAQLKSIDGLSGSGTSEKVQTSNLNDSTSQFALQRINLSETIKEYKEHIKTYEKAREGLTEDEQLVIEKWFNNDFKAKTKIEELELQGLSRTEIYKKRSSALEKLERKLIG